MSREERLGHVHQRVKLSAEKTVTIPMLVDTGATFSVTPEALARAILANSDSHRPGPTPFAWATADERQATSAARSRRRPSTRRPQRG